MAESLITPAAADYFDPRAERYRRWFDAAQSFDEFVADAALPHRQRWQALHARTRLTDEQHAFASGMTRQVNALVVAQRSCGDCMWQLPTLRRIEEASTKFTLRLVERDDVPELRDAVRMCGVAKVPVALFLSEDFFECSRFGERSLSTYRAISRAFLGPACPIGEIFDDAQLTSTTEEWVNEVERVHWMVRLSGPLRERHND